MFSPSHILFSSLTSYRGNSNHFNLGMCLAKVSVSCTADALSISFNVVRGESEAIKEVNNFKYKWFGQFGAAFLQVFLTTSQLQIACTN